MGGIDRIESLESILVNSIDASPFQVRVRIDPEHVASLASSIEDHDLSSHILVRPKVNGRYELICGENRLEAFKLLGKEKIRAIVRCLSDMEAAKACAADNLQRSELSDFEIFRTVRVLQENDFVKTDAQVSKIIGRSRSFVTKVKAFHDLPKEALEIVVQAPKLFGANMVADLKASGFNKTHPETVCEAFGRILNGALTQAGVLSFLRSRIKPAPSAALKDVTLKINSKTVRLTVYQDTIRISCKGMNSLAIEEQLQQALKALHFILQ